jgi:hypothetical protein
VLAHGCAGCTSTGVGVGVGRPGHGHEAKAPPIRYSQPEVNGRLPAELIQRVVRQNEGRFRLCYEKGLRGNPTLTGRVTTRFVIDRNGQVNLAADGGSDLPDATVRQCVISSFTALSFPESNTGMVTVTYPLMFTPEE